MRHVPGFDGMTPLHIQKTKTKDAGFPLTQPSPARGEGMERILRSTERVRFLDSLRRGS